MIVHLGGADLNYCAAAADARIEAWGNRHRNYGKTLTPQYLRRINRIGVLSELAVARALGKSYDWTSVPMRKDDDVDGIQVRGTDRHDGCLITHDDDIDGPYVLVTLSITGPRKVEATLRGWKPLAECNDPMFWRDDVPHPAYFVPQIALHPIGTMLN